MLTEKSLEKSLAVNRCQWNLHSLFYHTRSWGEWIPLFLAASPELGSHHHTHRTSVRQVTPVLAPGLSRLAPPAGPVSLPRAPPWSCLICLKRSLPRRTEDKIHLSAWILKPETSWPKLSSLSLPPVTRTPYSRGIWPPSQGLWSDDSFTPMKRTHLSFKASSALLRVKAAQKDPSTPQENPVCELSTVVCSWDVSRLSPIHHPPLLSGTI